jgi:neopullulanase
VEGDHDPDCRRAFPWDQSRWDGDGLAWTTTAYAARHALPALRRGSFRVAGADADAVAYVRGAVAGGGTVLVVVNAGEAPAEVQAWAPELAGVTLADVPLPGIAAGEVNVAADGAVTVPVPARTGRILRAPAA